MYTATVHLTTLCQYCQGNTYAEDESGFYVCQTCGSVTQIRCEAELEYEDFGRSFSKLRSKNINNSSDNEDNDNYLDNSIEAEYDSDNDTNFYTNVDTRNNSVMDDCSSTWSRKSSRKNIKIEKTLNEILFDAQCNFVNIYKALTKHLNIINKEHLYALVKKNWFEYIIKEYDIQIINEKTVFGKGRKPNLKFARSRTNTMDESDNMNKMKGNVIKKQSKIKDQIKHRKVKECNIVSLFKGTNKNKENAKTPTKKEFLKQFIEEYDEVVNFVKTSDFIYEKCSTYFNIDAITHTLTYEQIIKVCIALNIDLSSKNSFEELIHKIFVDQSLNYQTTHHFAFNSQKSILNSDYYLSIFYKTLNKQTTFPLLSCELISKYKHFDYISDLSIDDINLLKYSNRDNYIKLINDIDKKDKHFINRAKLILLYIIKDILCLNYDIVIKLALNIFDKIKDEIHKFMKNNYLLEHICIGIVLYCLKVIYGLNDLPYLSIISKMKKSFYLNESDVQMYNINTKNDFLSSLYKELPALPDIFKRLFDLIKNETNNEIVTLTEQMKCNFSKEYKEKYTQVNYDNVYKDVHRNTYGLKNICELENKFKKFHTHIKKNNEGNKNKKVYIKLSENFLKKKNEIENRKTQGKKMSQFIREEIDFHQNIRDNKDEDLNGIEFPLPCDTYIRYQRNAFKFRGVEHKLSETLILYCFAKKFQISFTALKSLMKFTERAVELKDQ